MDECMKFCCQGLSLRSKVVSRVLNYNLPAITHSSNTCCGLCAYIEFALWPPTCGPGTPGGPSWPSSPLAPSLPGAPGRPGVPLGPRLPCKTAQLITRGPLMDSWFNLFISFLLVIKQQKSPTRRIVFICCPYQMLKRLSKIGLGQHLKCC